MTFHRTRFALTALVAAALTLAGGTAAAQALKVAVYGGYFQDSFDAHIFPRFTEETGIAVESIAAPTGMAWLVQLETAARAGQAPADVSMMSQGPLQRGMTSDLWVALDEDRLPNVEFVRPALVNRDAQGRLVGVGAVSWFVTLVTNTDTYPEAPTSWAELWGDHRNSLGLLALPENSFLLEITAATFFGGTDILDTEEGILEVVDKLTELQPNVQLWYRDEGQFQQALQSGEIPMGQYYHDVTGIAADEGFPVRSTFPAEGGVLDSGSWAVTRASQMVDEAHVFIDWFSQPEVQDLVARMIGTAPTVEREHLSLSDEEFAFVSDAGDPIVPRYDMYLERGDWLNQIWAERVTR
jgi:putative spermidine/putrescine transport system substrate-binding protein